LQTRGINNQQAMNHIALVHNPVPGPYVFALMVQKSPFSRQQTFALQDAVIQRRLSGVWIPNQAASPNYGPYPALADGSMNLAQFINYFRQGDGTGNGLDISPCPDNRPFVLDLSLQTLPIFKGLTAFTFALALVLAVFGLWQGGRAGITPESTLARKHRLLPRAVLLA
jgi:hypothetical protein